MLDDTFTVLNDNLLKQTSGNKSEPLANVTHYMQAASLYSQIENSIAVLSDLKANVSYIYYGGITEVLGIVPSDNPKCIESIWEEEILSRIHPDDLLQKHVLELGFLNFIKKLPRSEKPLYHILGRMRMKDRIGDYIEITHRMYYIYGPDGRNPQLALCLYGRYTKGNGNERTIVNSVTGECLDTLNKLSKNILSEREKQVLRLIRQGKTSHKISETLFISRHTVNRHRQNILEKLHAVNSAEACNIAEVMRLI